MYVVFKRMAYVKPGFFQNLVIRKLLAIRLSLQIAIRVLLLTLSEACDFYSPWLSHPMFLLHWILTVLSPIFCVSAACLVTREWNTLFHHTAVEKKLTSWAFSKIV